MTPRFAFETRPWGTFEVLLDEPCYKVKRLCVQPGQRLSLQSHRHRSEHWVVVSGRPTIHLDGQTCELGYGESVFVPAGMRHRVANHGAEPVVIMEVQIGESFEETDIIRYEDDYRRHGAPA
ncbi:MAG: phosphomannose isomerase type II C-terminal cupin domain [Candidatus Schekmanbacteria bacterium]|nr:phosphomannose isomerase type II C-terminal cupin domain [Candidatus Schekmanbacteria bacterium]